MTATFETPRAALAYMFSCRRGPQLASPSYHNASPSTGHTPWDAPVIGALLYGPESQGMCAVEIGGDLDAELEEWALGYGVELSDRAADVVRQMRRLMLEHRVKPQSEPARASDVFRWTDPDGRTWASLRGPVATRPRVASRSPQSSG